MTLLVHADTVFEDSSGFSGFKVSADGKTANGPGVIDDKGGMVVILSGLKQYLLQNPVPKYSIRVISNSGEEVGSSEFVPQFQKYAADSVLVLGFEPSLEDGSIVNSRFGNRWYEVKVKGREAHSGHSHREGINACWALAKKLDELSKLTDYHKNITVSIGHMEGGHDKFNIVCGEASAKIDTRFEKAKDQAAFQKDFDKVMNSNPVCAASDQVCAEASYTIADETLPFEATPQSLEYIKNLKSLIQKIEGRSVEARHSGGTADTNNLAYSGLAIIDGLGPTGGNMHTKEEFIVLSSLDSRAKVLAQFLEKEFP